MWRCWVDLNPHSVRCPKCDAVPGRRCVAVKSGYSTNPHQARRKQLIGMLSPYIREVR